MLNVDISSFSLIAVGKSDERTQNSKQSLVRSSFGERTLRGEAARLSRRALLPWPSRAAHKPATGFVNLVLGSD